MDTRPFLFALALAASSVAPRAAQASPAIDPRVPINAVNTPGDAESEFRITQPGSYYLEANLTAAPGRHGLVIAASDVHVDLMGFALHGNFVGENAIAVSGALVNVSIHNGTIYFWNGLAVAAQDAASTAIRDLQVRSTLLGGIHVGRGAKIERCRVWSSGSFGIRAGESALVADVHVDNAYGGVGIQTSGGSIVRNCLVTQAGHDGVNVGAGSLVLACVVNEAGMKGISGDRTTVQACVVRQSAGPGISLARGTVQDCEVANNQANGIEILLGSGLVVGNQVAANGQNGIYVQNGARVEENDVRDHTNGTGILVLGARSFVAKNSLFGNASPLSVPLQGNFVGPLVAVNAVNGRGDPWANFHWN